MPTDQPDTFKTLRIFIASPSDLHREREIFRRVIGDINAGQAATRGLRLQPLGADVPLPGQDQPQTLIHQDIEACDLFILLLWKRWDVPSAKHGSCTEEQFRLARTLSEARGGRPEMWLYVRRVPDDMLADPGPQLRRVLDFRHKIEAERALIYHPYDGAEVWKRLLRAHLSRWLDSRPPFHLPPAPVELPPDIQTLQALLCTTGVPACSSLVPAAAALTRQAIDAARLGRPTQAAECFAAALALAELPATLLAYGWFFSLSQQWDQQIAACNRALAIQPAYARAYSQRALAYRAQGLLSRAITDCNAAIRLQPNLATPYHTRALIYCTQRALSCAIADCDRAIALQPAFAEAYHTRALACAQKGDRARALADLHQALALTADSHLRAGLQQDLDAL